MMGGGYSSQGSHRQWKINQMLCSGACFLHRSHGEGRAKSRVPKGLQLKSPNTFLENRWWSQFWWLTLVNISAGLLSRIENLYGGTDGGILQSDPFSRILTESTNIVLKILTDPHRYLTDISQISHGSSQSTNICYTILVSMSYSLCWSKKWKESANGADTIRPCALHTGKIPTCLEI